VTASTIRFQDHQTDYQDRPFPNLVVDGILDAEMFDAVLSYWPDSAMFAEASGQNRVQLPLLKEWSYGRLQVAQAAFWRKFSEITARDIVRESMCHLAQPLFGKPTAGAGGMALKMIDLVQLAGDHEALPVHTHYNDRLLLGTCIIYVDDAGGSARGTELYGPKPSFMGADELARIVAGDIGEASLSDHLEIARRVAFKPNRALVMADGPVSWHGVPLGPTVNGPRRQIIINWALDESCVEGRYGVDFTTFVEARFLSPQSPRVHDWLKEDIDRQRNPRRLPSDEARALFEKVPISV
jgi:hypothetical protein